MSAPMLAWIHVALAHKKTSQLVVYVQRIFVAMLHNFRTELLKQNEKWREKNWLAKPGGEPMPWPEFI